MRKVHLGCNCHPYAYAWYIFCRSDLIYEDKYDTLSKSENIKEVTCKRCIKIDAKSTKEMIEAGLLNPDGTWRGFDETEPVRSIG